MQVETFKNNNITSFRMKNTFLNKAKNARTVTDKKYWESLHNEAKARLNYSKFHKAEKELEKINDNDSIIVFVKQLSKIAYRKALSVIYSDRAHSKFPERFSGGFEKV